MQTLKSALRANFKKRTYEKQLPPPPPPPLHEERKKKKKSTLQKWADKQRIVFFYSIFVT